MTESQKRKKVVVFGANGGIGEEVAFQLAQQMDGNSHQFDVHLVTRKGKDENGKDRPNIGIGVAREIRETMPHAKCDLALAFADEHHLLWDDKNPDSLKDVLSGADVIINPAGAPRRMRADGSAPERSELIAQNADLAHNLGTAIGKFAPVKALVVNCANPADNIGMMIEEGCRKAWAEMGIKDNLPEHKVLTMGGTLDESRFREFLAEEINKNLGSGQARILPADIQAMVYGQHGNAMVFDPDIRIGQNGHTQSLEQFLESKGLSNEREAILKTVKQRTTNGGGDLLKVRGRTAQRAPAARIAEITMAALFSDRPYTLTGAVTHDWSSDIRKVASGCRINVSPNGAAIDPQWLEKVKNSSTLVGDITNSRKAIVADQAAFELLPLLKGASINRAGTDDNSRVSITIDNPELDKQKTARLIAEALIINQDAVTTERASKPTFSFDAPKALLGKVTKLAVALGIIGSKEEIPVDGPRMG